MATCPVCGGINFEKHAGYLYCMECQTQSQDYHEQEYEYGEHDVTKTSKAQKTKKPKKKKEDEDLGTTTSWDIFNHILYGMTQEMVSICKIANFESTVLQLWACYLNRLEAGFTSKTKENMPRLQLNYRSRDAKILYNFDAISIKSSMKSSASKKSTRKSMDSQSSSANDSRLTQRRKKKKIADSDYQEQMSSQTLDTSLADETIESLGRSDDDISLPTSDEIQLAAVKECFTRDAYKKYKSSRKSPKIFKNMRRHEEQAVQYLSKNKLLAIINLALLLTNSDVYLSDLLRYIREGHLSFAKVTHFLPRTTKVSKKDLLCIESSSDICMPTHIKQRELCKKIAMLINIEEIAYPDVIGLLDRYCKELKLPDEVRAYGTKILNLIHKGDVIKFTSTGPKLPNFEGMAMGTIIFVLKLYFGLDDKTEKVLSNTARVVNRFISKNENQLFVFEDWQKFIECRKTIIKDYHYPTQEQLNDDCYSSKKFIEMLMKDTKDEFRDERFIRINQTTLFKDEFLTGVKDFLSSMSEEKELTVLDFKPSQTPQESYLKTILERCEDRLVLNYLSLLDGWTNPKHQNKKAILNRKAALLLSCSSDLNSQSLFSQDGNRSSQQQKFPWKILNSDFSKCVINFGANLDKFTEILENEKFKVVQLTRSELLNLNLKDVDKSMENKEIYFIDCSTDYWIKSSENRNQFKMYRFKSEIFPKMPYNFQWLLSECARLTEMNVYNLHQEIRQIELKFTYITYLGRRKTDL